MYIHEEDRSHQDLTYDRIKIMNKNFFLIRSFSEAEKWYEVRRLDSENVWQCTCPDFRNKLRKGLDNKICKHIQRAQM